MNWLNKKRLQKVALILIAAFFISQLLLFIFEKEFNQIEWQSKPHERYQMLDDIIENKFLIGKTKQEIILILGEPDRDLTLSGNNFVYQLGEPPSFFNAKPQYLLISFMNDKVVKLNKATE